LYSHQLHSAAKGGKTPTRRARYRVGFLIAIMNLCAMRSHAGLRRC